MVVFLLVSGLLFGSSRMSEKHFKDRGKYQPNLILDDLQMIEVIEEIEIEMINKGLNPDTLTFEKVQQILNEKIHNNDLMKREDKNRKYNEFLEKIGKYRENLSQNNQNSQ